ncbi:MAG: hypothetical protein ABIB04_03335 [Patescibacteria group bacterium]
MSRKIGALWLKETKDGKKYFSGVIEDLRGDIRIAVFKNDRKEKENQPDYQIIVSEERREQHAPADQTSTATDEVNLDDIPF